MPLTKTLKCEKQGSFSFTGESQRLSDMATTRNLIPPLQEKEEEPFEAARTIPRQVQGVI